MRQFEYKVDAIHLLAVESGSALDPHPDIPSLNQQGLAGWELVCLTPTTAVDRAGLIHMAIFKREIAP